MPEHRPKPPSSQLSRSKRIIFRGLMIALTLLTTALLIEGILWVAAAFVGPRALNLSPSAGQEVVLCLGDSNTYGVFYPQEQAYPAQLQDVLDRRAPERYRTLNLGLPGMNSAQVAARLEAWIERYRPGVVVVGVGINNYWNQSDTDKQSMTKTPLLARSRSYRLLRLLMTEATKVPDAADRPEIDWVLPNGGLTHNQQFDADTGELLIEHRGNWKDWNRSHEDVSAELARDLTTIRRLTAERGVELVVLTYAAFPLPDREVRYLKQRNVNATMRDWAQQHDATLVDLTERFIELLPSGTPRSTVFANEKDSHPNPVGYREVAQRVADAIHPGATRVHDFLDHFDGAVIEREDVPYEQFALKRVRIDRDERMALFQHPTTAVSFPAVVVPAGARLVFAAALRPDAWERAGDGVDFIVEVIDPRGERREVFSRYIDPKHNEEDRRWVEASVDLGPYAGERVTVVLRALPGPDDNRYFDWSIWGEPRLVSEANGSAP